ncbi:hypothetical protein GCM10028867_26730 [Nocardioides pacificus]
MVGRLARDVAAVDVDAGGVEGDAIAEHLAGWLTGRGRWHLLRPSGGGPGRWHVLCLPGEDTAAFAAYVEDLRITYGLAKVQVDHRGVGGGSHTLRPLSSPHRRTGVVPAPLGTAEQLRAALAALPRAPKARTKSARTRRADRAAGAAATRGLVPLPRARREVEPRWQAWLEGRGPAPVVLGPDQSRSAIELAATSAMVRAGLDIDEAWQRVLTARGGAFERSRDRGRGWWTRHHWDTAVQTDTAWRTTHPEGSSQGPAALTPSESTRAAVAAARRALSALQWTFGPRQRHSILLVAHTLLERMLRVDELAVPCPLRDLELDTGLARGTVLSALRALHGPLGRRLESFDHSRADSSSHVFELDPRFAKTDLSLLEPPGFTPTPRHPGLWAALAPTAHSVWQALPRPEGVLVTEAELGQEAGLTHGPTDLPTPRQLRTLRSVLEELETAGLAQRDPEGHWQRAATPTACHQRRGSATRRLLLERIARERAEYRAGAWSRWHRERLAVLRRTRTRQRDWWSSLPEQARQTRRQQLVQWYAQLSQDEQFERRGRIAATRHRAGEPSERSLHAAWSRQFTRAEQADVSAAWQAKFAALSPHERQLRRHKLDDHRRRWGLPPTWSTASSPAQTQLRASSVAA